MTKKEKKKGRSFLKSFYPMLFKVYFGSPFYPVLSEICFLKMYILVDLVSGNHRKVKMECVFVFYYKDDTLYISIYCYLKF